MFVRSRVARGRTYYAVVESYREGGKVRHRQLAALGTNPDLRSAVARTRRAIASLKARLALLPAQGSGGARLGSCWVHRMRERTAERLALQQARLDRLLELRARTGRGA